MSPRRLLFFLVFATFTLGLRAVIAPSADEVAPLPVGSKVPAVMVRAVDGAALDLAAVLAGKPTVLIFYRGSWCPYCNRHLAALAALEPKLLAKGYQIIALSPDEAAGLEKMTAKNHLNYRLLSDHAMAAASAFGVAFRLNDQLRKAYEGYGVTLTPIPDEPGGRWLPVPAVFIIGRDGRIKFVHADPNYKVRLSAEAVLAAAEAAL